jgi:hypothetical protein
MITTINDKYKISHVSLVCIKLVLTFLKGIKLVMDRLSRVKKEVS